MKITQPGSHLDQMLRQTRWHHVQLSSMADMKANMLLTISSVLITLSVRYVTEPPSRWAASTLVLFCLLTILLSAYSVMPKLPLALRAGPPPNPESDTFNLLFFGDFMRLSYPEFEQAMEKVMNDHNLAYEAQVRDLYLLGIFLARKKYRFVRLAYLSFTLGFLCSGIVLLSTAKLA